MNALKLLNEYKVYPMEKECTLAFMVLLTAEDEAVKGFEAEFQDEFIYKMFVKRMEAISANSGVKIDAAVIVAILLCGGLATPGHVSLYVHTLYELSKRRNEGGRYTLELLCEDFPAGFPGQDELAEAWAAQKQGGANRVDMQETYQ